MWCSGWVFFLFKNTSYVITPKKSQCVSVEWRDLERVTAGSDWRHSCSESRGDRIKVRLESKAGISKHWNSCQGRLHSTVLRRVGPCVSGHFPSRSLKSAWAPLPAYCVWPPGCWDVCTTAASCPTGYCRPSPRMILLFLVVSLLCELICSVLHRPH